MLMLLDLSAAFFTDAYETLLHLVFAENIYRMLCNVV